VYDRGEVADQFVQRCCTNRSTCKNSPGNEFSTWRLVSRHVLLEEIYYDYRQLSTRQHIRNRHDDKQRDEEHASASVDTSPAGGLISLLIYAPGRHVASS